MGGDSKRPEKAEPAALAARVLSLDAFRGFTIAAMLLVNNPGSWSHLYGPLAHAPWHGWTFTDWVFPFFVFISGMAMPISLDRRAHAGHDRVRLLLQTWRRALMLVLIGLALNAIPHFNWAELRWPGVLQRLGLVTMLAAPIVLWWGWRGRLGWALGLMAVYAAVMLWVPVPGADGVVRAGSLQPGQDAGAWLDRFLFDGHLWKQSRTWDPEGLLSTLPAVSSLLLGVLAGQWLFGAGTFQARHARMPLSEADRVLALMVVGLLCLWIGEILHAWLMPINKNLWTPAYVFSTTGWALLIMGSFHWLLDAAPLPRLRARCAQWAQPLVVFGVNALFLFVLSGLIAKALAFIKPDGQQSLKAWVYGWMQQLGLSPVNTSLLYALVFLTMMWGVAWLLWRKRWFIRV